MKGPLEKTSWRKPESLDWSLGCSTRDWVVQPESMYIASLSLQYMAYEVSMK